MAQLPRTDIAERNPDGRVEQSADASIDARLENYGDIVLRPV